ncbi:MAG TPA: hypothetical protein VHV26_17650, partial [Rhizomicrobium sp.]|nr:hypothetical protein [Rhizomicrobium sp.]
MKITYFTHSLISCWNHGNAHFLRGVMRELVAMGHDVTVFEPKQSWSRQNLVREHGEQAVAEFNAHFPTLAARINYLTANDEPAIDKALDKADLVLVHEWNQPELVASIGRRRR